MIKKIITVINIFILFSIISVGTIAYAESYSTYNHASDVFIGQWKICDAFELNAQILNDIYEAEEAEKYIGEVITYQDSYYTFQNQKFPFEVSHVEFYTSEELKSATTGSVARGYGFKELRVEENVKIIRSVCLYVDKAIWSFFGEHFFVVDNNTLLIHWRGWIFKAIRQE